MRGNVRRISTSYKFRNVLGTGSFAVEPPKAVGIASSRGQRLYQEDALSAKVLNLSMTQSMKDNQCAYFGIFDGHGGPFVSQYLRDHLANLIERVSKRDWSLLDYFRVYGNYFPYDRGHSGELTIKERLMLAFLKADKAAITDAQNRAYMCGSTASVLLLQSLDDPPASYAYSGRLQMSTAHCGDTAILLVKAHSGTVERLTDDDHADNIGEAARLKHFRGALVQDSYGESRLLGQIANTRSIGDAKYKSWGVTAEPHTQSSEIDGRNYSLAMLVSDGILNTISIQEVADVARSKFAQQLVRGRAAQAAAQAVVDFAIDVGADDNCSALAVPLPGFMTAGKGRDKTRDLRDYRLQLANDPDSVRQRRQ